MQERVAEEVQRVLHNARTINLMCTRTKDIQEKSYNVYAVASSAEFVRERYAVHAIPTVDTKGWNNVSDGPVIRTGSTYNLILNGHNSEVNDLNRRPNHPVGFQGRNINILEFALHSALPTALSNSHESEEAGKTY